MSKSSVFVVHNEYQQAGGEDEVVLAELAMLRAHGHTVEEYRVSNKSIEGMNRIALLQATLWNRSTYRRMTEAVRGSRVPVVHFHNTFPLISPSAYYAVRRQGAAVVQTLHNYRLLCPNALFFREERVCEDCLGQTVPWPSVVHACYRGSRPATAAVASMLTLHRALGTWTRSVDVYIALTEFSRRKFIQGGLPPDRVVVKPNFAPDPGVGSHSAGHVLFVGRLSPEKGLETLLRAWTEVRRRHPNAELKIAGAGPLHTLAREPVAGVEWLGWQPRQCIQRLMRETSVLVLPSQFYEGFPMTIVEAFSAGLPVVTSGLGSMVEVVRDGETGRVCRPGDPQDLADVLVTLLATPGQLRDMGRRARLEYEAKYTPQRNYEQLMKIYALALEHRISATAAHSVPWQATV